MAFILRGPFFKTILQINPTRHFDILTIEINKPNITNKMSAPVFKIAVKIGPLSINVKMT
jgi:hypothetical protein